MTEDAYARLMRLAAAAGLPGVELGTSYGKPALKVAGRAFTGWKPDGALPLRLSAAQKEFLLDVAPEIYFQTDHYKGSVWLLLRLNLIADDELQQRLVDAWRLAAPKKLLAAFDAKAG